MKSALVLCFFPALLAACGSVVSEGSPSEDGGSRPAMGTDPCLSLLCPGEAPGLGGPFAPPASAQPSATDGIRNGKETDVDCGGPSSEAPRCEDTKRCEASTDCTSAVCTDGACAAPRSDDGVKNGTETDVDCGGDGLLSPRCADGRSCGGASDCSSGVCAESICAAPRPDDGVKNGTETDVDCGGPDGTVPRCAVKRTCLDGADCSSGTCGDMQSTPDFRRCLVAPSCAGQPGSDSCGAGESPDGDKRHESCCTSLEVPRPAGAVRLDKYEVTTGRFRLFATRFSGNLQSWAATNPPGWNRAWDRHLPSSWQELEEGLAFGRQSPGEPTVGCSLQSGGARTFAFRAQNPLASVENLGLDATVLDEKSMNCADWYMMNAFCIWDGGRLPTTAEFEFAWTAGQRAQRDYPWGNAAPTAAHVVHGFGPWDDGQPYPNPYWPFVRFSYRYPTNFFGNVIVHIGAPGRKPLGAGPFGHMDLVGNMFEWLGDDVQGSAANYYLGGSWEAHRVTMPLPGSASRQRHQGYWAVGGRCARPAR